MQLPNYRDGSIVNLMAALQVGLGGAPHPYAPLLLLPPEEVQAHRQVLLLVVDGLGLRYLQAHPDAACLHGHLQGGMTSVFPPTTATAVTSFLTGQAPAQHGLTGWHMYFRELGSVLAVLPGRARYGGVGLTTAGIDATALFGHESFANRIGVEAWNIAPAHIVDSDFNRAHLGRARSLSYRTLPELVTAITEVLQQRGPRYVYAYWPGLDSLGHEQGIWSDAARAHLAELDQAFETLLRRVRGTDTLVILTADHGQIDTLAADRLCLDDYPELAESLVLPLCGESRTVYCYLRPGCEARFDAAVAQQLAGIASCFPSSQLLEQGWFGAGVPHPRLAQRIGDRVLVMGGSYTLKDWLSQERRHTLIGVHGGLSADELLVPLVMAKT